MKKIILLAGIATILFTNCEHEHIYNPLADFSASSDLIVPGEVVFFTNESQYGEYYEWDFGDGFVSNAVNPNHYYSAEGIYEVRLAAYNEGRVDYAYFTIDVYETSLEVEVREWETETLITDINVTLYPTYDDWYNFSNPIISGYTNRDGIVVFKGLNTSRYYLDIYSQYYDNEALGMEDVGFIETLPLEYASHNVFVAYVDYYPAGSAASMFKSTDRVRTLVIKEIKRVYKDKKAAIEK